VTDQERECEIQPVKYLHSPEMISIQILLRYFRSSTVVQPEHVCGVFGETIRWAREHSGTQTNSELEVVVLTSNVNVTCIYGEIICWSHHL